MDSGCGINLVVKDGQDRGISPLQHNPINEGKVCIRGDTLFEFVNRQTRITTLLIRKDGKFVEAGARMHTVKILGDFYYPATPMFTHTKAGLKAARPFYRVSWRDHCGYVPAGRRNK